MNRREKILAERILVFFWGSQWATSHLIDAPMLNQNAIETIFSIFDRVFFSFTSLIYSFSSICRYLNGMSLCRVLLFFWFILFRSHVCVFSLSFFLKIQIQKNNQRKRKYEENSNTWTYYRFYTKFLNVILLWIQCEAVCLCVFFYCFRFEYGVYMHNFCVSFLFRFILKSFISAVFTVVTASCLTFCVAAKKRALTAVMSMPTVTICVVHRPWTLLLSR